MLGPDVVVSLTPREKDQTGRGHSKLGICPRDRSWKFVTPLSVPQSLRPIFSELLWSFAQERHISQELAVTRFDVAGCRCFRPSSSSRQRGENGKETQCPFLVFIYTLHYPFFWFFFYLVGPGPPIRVPSPLSPPSSPLIGPPISRPPSPDYTSWDPLLQSPLHLTASSGSPFPGPHFSGPPKIWFVFPSSAQNARFGLPSCSPVIAQVFFFCFVVAANSVSIEKMLPTLERRR